MDYLAELGIQRWRVREPVLDDYLGQQNPHKPEELVQAGEPVALAKGANLLLEQRERGPSDRSSPMAENLEDSWAKIVADVNELSTCKACAPTHPILGEGDQDADWVVVVDAPTQRDIDDQKLLGGRDGQLLDAMLAAIGLSRAEIYLTSIFKCAPSEDYHLTPTCNSLLSRQIALIKPSKVLVFGEFAAQTVLRSNDPLSVLRAKPHASKSMQTTVGVTASMTEILTKPACKAMVWQDLCRLQRARAFRTTNTA